MQLHEQSLDSKIRTNLENRKNIYALALISLSLLSACVLLLRGARNEIKYIWILPLLFGIGFWIINRKAHRKHGLAYYLINTVMFIRYSVGPFLSLFNIYYVGLVKDSNAQRLPTKLLVCLKQNNQVNL